MNNNGKICSQLALSKPQQHTSAPNGANCAHRLAEVAPDGSTYCYECRETLSVPPTIDHFEIQPTATRKGTSNKWSTFIDSVLQDVELFCDPNGTEYCTFNHDGHNETARIRSRHARNFLQGMAYQRFEQAIPSNILDQAVGILENKARLNHIRHTVHVRLAFKYDAIWVDLGDQQWRAIRINGDGWQIVTNPPVKFRRPKGMLCLPEPVKGGNLETLRPLLNLEDDDSFALIRAWLVGAFNPNGALTILLLHGEQGSSKTTASRFLRSLLDPNVSPVRSLPRKEHDLVIEAQDGLVMAFDNISYLTSSLSDALCRLSTGSGFGIRQLYTDAEQTIFNSKRPIMLNGIEEVATRSDLLDRAIAVYLPPIADDQRITEEELWRRFVEMQPGLLGALFDAVSMAMKRLPEVRSKIRQWPRMADFAAWATAAEPALGLEEGSLIAAYARNRSASTKIALDSSIVALAIIGLMAARSQWEGTPTDLLKLLTLADEATTRSKAWPKDGKGLSNAIRQVTPNLRNMGIEVEFHRTSTARTITLRRASAIGPSASEEGKPLKGGPRCTWDLTKSPPGW